MLDSFEGVKFTKGPHLILAKNAEHTHTWFDRLEHCSGDAATRLIERNIGNNWYHSTINEWWEDVLKKEQALISTMNPFLVDCFFFKSAEDAHLRIILVDAYGVAENLDISSAERFYWSYQAGIQHVSEILVSDEIW